MENTNVKITPLPNGPLMIEGTVSVVNNEGKPEVKEQKSFLCRCGQSKNKPYCDGSHKQINFQG